MNSKRIKYVSVRPETTKSLEENTGSNFSDMGQDIFLDAFLFYLTNIESPTDWIKKILLFSVICFLHKSSEIPSSSHEVTELEVVLDTGDFQYIIQFL